MSASGKYSWFLIDNVIQQALNEDIGNGDITSQILLPENHKSTAELVAKADFIVAGMPFFERVFHMVDRKIECRMNVKDGAEIKTGTVMARITGTTRGILTAERTALNLLQRMCGIATMTSEFVKAVKGHEVKITDTRKTAPGLRFFDKYAVRAGGGQNHRFGLYDGLLIKDNHIAAVGSIKGAVKRARSGAHHLSKIEVEVKNLSEAREALSAGADIIMLDNMPPEKMRKAVVIIRSSAADVLIEASGNVELDTIGTIAETGVDFISAGALTHSVTAADISLKFK